MRKRNVSEYMLELTLCLVYICEAEAEKLCTQFNSKKCSVIRFGGTTSKCCEVTMLGNSIYFVSSVKLLTKDYQCKNVTFSKMHKLSRNSTYRRNIAYVKISRNET